MYIFKLFFPKTILKDITFKEKKNLPQHYILNAKNFSRNAEWKCTN